jgi:hypothetical protein
MQLRRNQSGQVSSGQYRFHNAILQGEFL